MIEAIAVIPITLVALIAVLAWADRRERTKLADGIKEEREIPVQFTIAYFLDAARAGDYGNIWPMSDMYCDAAGLPRGSYRTVER